MFTRFAGFVIISVIACPLPAQTPAAQIMEQVLYFTSVSSPQGMQEVNNALRAMAEVQVPQMGEQSMTIRGTPPQIALAEWLFNQLDKPAAVQPAAPGTPSPRYDYTLPNGQTEPVSIFYFTHPVNLQAIQEAINTLRAVTEIGRSFPDIEQRAIVLRGSGPQMALCEWIFHQLDQPATAQPAKVGTPPAKYEYSVANGKTEPVEVYRFTHRAQPRWNEVVRNCR